MSESNYSVLLNANVQIIYLNATFYLFIVIGPFLKSIGFGAVSCLQWPVQSAVCSCLLFFASCHNVHQVCRICRLSDSLSHLVPPLWPFPFFWPKVFFGGVQTMYIWSFSLLYYLKIKGLPIVFYYRHFVLAYSFSPHTCLLFLCWSDHLSSFRNCLVICPAEAPSLSQEEPIFLMCFCVAPLTSAVFCDMCPKTKGCKGDPEFIVFKLGNKSQRKWHSSLCGSHIAHLWIQNRNNKMLFIVIVTSGLERIHVLI